MGTRMRSEERQDIAAAEHLRAVQEQHARSFAMWALVPMFSGGFLAFVPFAVAAHRTGRRKYRIAAGVWLVLALTVVVLLALGGQDALLGGPLIFVNACGGALHTLAIRNEYAHELALDYDPSRVAAERRVALRRRARELARRDPAHALELGIGRPDLADAFDAGLIDVNHAPVHVLEQLPGIDAGQARRIVELRMSGTGFVSAEDLDMVLDLDPGTLRELAARAVFLPRA